MPHGRKRRRSRGEKGILAERVRARSGHWDEGHLLQADSPRGCRSHWIAPGWVRKAFTFCSIASSAPKLLHWEASRSVASEITAVGSAPFAIH